MKEEKKTEVKKETREVLQSGPGKIIEFKVPDLGENIESADVINVLVKVGDSIVKDQGVIEIETDKATVEVPSSVAGKIVEERKIAFRQMRDGANKSAVALPVEDERFKAKEKIQGVIDKANKEVETLLAAKLKDISE